MKQGDGDLSFFRYRKTGGIGYHCSAIGSTALTTLVNTTSGRLMALPFFCGRNFAADRLAFNVTTLIASKYARVGIYEDTGLIYPGNLIVQAAEFSTGSTGVKETTLSPVIILQRGKLYWLAFWSNSTATGAFRSIPVADLYPICGLDSGLGTAWGVGWYYNGSYPAGGSLLDPFTAGGIVLTSVVHASIPGVFLRAA